jgi:hypothetical protein
MKKTILSLAFCTLCISTFTSCDTYRSLNNATSIGQLSGNPFLQNVARSITKSMGTMLLQNGIKNIGKLGLNSSIGSLLSSAQAVSSFKGMLSNTYGLSSGLIDKNYSKLNTIKDVVGLVASSGTKGLNFFN